MQWGIASFAKQLGGNLKCGRSFSAYTDVAALRNWIDDGVTLLTRTTFLATCEPGHRACGSTLRCIGLGFSVSIRVTPC